MTFGSSLFVHIGPAAIRVHGGWVGVASGNRRAGRVRRTPERALRDAQKIEAKPERFEAVTQ